MAKDLSKMSAQELLALAQSQIKGVQDTKDKISAKGGFTNEGLTSMTNKLKTANDSLTKTATSKGYTVPKVTAPTPTPTVQQQPAPQFSSPTERAGNYATLSAALQNAINLGRAQRQSAELDFLGGVIPEGAVSAGTFTGLLANLNKASNQFTQPLTEQVLDFARDEQDAVREQQNDIRDLALAMVQAGASQESVSGVLNAGDINSAISMAAGSLNTSAGGKETIQQVGSNLVAYDEEGNVRVLFTASSGGGGGSSGGTTNTGVFNSGAIRVSDQELGQMSTELENTRGADGYANTQLYTDAFNQWVSNGGLPQDFFKTYDPDYFLNPNDPSIPAQIKSQMKQSNRPNNPFD